MTKKSEHPQIVVYGLDSTGKAQAGRFAESQAKTAREAAAALKLSVLEIGPELDDLTKAIPMGRLHARGKAFVPYIKQDLYEKLVSALTTPGKANAAQIARPAIEQSLAAIKAAEAAALPKSWDAVAPGHLVLLQESLPDGWYEAVVLARDGENLTLRFRDHPKYPNFIRNVRSVALVHPGIG